VIKVLEEIGFDHHIASRKYSARQSDSCFSLFDADVFSAHFFSFVISGEDADLTYPATTAPAANVNSLFLLILHTAEQGVFRSTLKFFIAINNDDCEGGFSRHGMN